MNLDWKNRLDTLGDVGLNAWGVADGSSYEQVLPGCRSVVVIGSGGTRLWEAFRADLQAHPAHLSEEAHPLDAYVARTLCSLDPEPGQDRRWIRCAADEPDPVDFRPLAREAGLGWRSMLGLLIHPEFGPWLGIRAACFTTEQLTPTGPLPGEGPCPDCHAPCITACPGEAMSRPPGVLGDLGGWDVATCSTFHQVSDRCATTCHSRVACPEGFDHRYGEMQRRYHYNRKIGRKEMGLALGIEDAREGLGPFWGEWTDKA